MFYDSSSSSNDESDDELNGMQNTTSSVVPRLVTEVSEIKKRSIADASPTTKAAKSIVETAPMLVSPTPMKRVKVEDAIEID